MYRLAPYGGLQSVGNVAWYFLIHANGDLANDSASGEGSYTATLRPEARNSDAQLAPMTPAPKIVVCSNIAMKS